MINTPNITLKVQGMVSETSIEDDCTVTWQEHELSFYLNRNPNPTLSLLIGKNQVYIIDAEVAHKILELITTVK